ncbi:hypothetical protein ACFL4T_00300 [candidate division KSB1 bacterium]
MNKLLDIFSSDSDDIEIAGINNLTRLCKYHPKKKDDFLDGLELAEDLASNDGVTLYTTGTNITPDRIARLTNLQENNPNMVMQFKLKRSQQLISNFKGDISKKLIKILAFRKNYKVYASLMGSIEKDIELLVNDLLADENIVLSIYKMKFIVDSSENKNAAMYFNHTISVVLFAYAIARTGEMREMLKFEDEDFKELLKAAFFHNIGAIVDIESILGLDEGQREIKYHESNRNSGYLLNNVRLGVDAMDAIRYVGEYFFNQTDFINREDDKGSWMANLILIADKYARLESGLFGVKLKPSHIVDRLNVEAANKKLNVNVVRALTLVLKFKDIFDFYMEMENLKNLCDFQGGKHAWPYPLTGFKSPTIFICKSHISDCENFEKSVKAVNLVKTQGDLKEGEYSRCLLTTPKLLEFYSQHYEEIKDNIQKQAPQKK